MDKLSAEEEQTLDEWLQLISEGYSIQIDADNAAKALKEIKQVLDGLGITFFLMGGTCLGAIRDNGFIPWDDDIDLGSVIGLHGFTEESLEEIVTAFRSNGFLTRIHYYGVNPYLPLVKHATYASWSCLSITNGHVVQFPFLNTPLELFTDLKEIDFLDDKYCVPNPPEEFLRLKYGDDWQLPKRSGVFEDDVLFQVMTNPTPNKVGRLRHLLAKYIPWEQTCKIRILDGSGEQVSGAEVIAIGLGNCKTDSNGCAHFYVPQSDFHPIIIRHGDYEKRVYLQRIGPGEEYTFRLGE